MSKPAGLWVALSLVAAMVMVDVGGATAAGQNVYSLQSLVSDGPQVSAPGTDALLVNGWGLSAGPTTPWWVSNNHSNTSTLYSGVGGKVALTVAVPGGPTGTVFNPSTTAFAV